MVDVDLTESVVSDLLIATAKSNGELSPRVVIVNRSAINPDKSIQRKTTFALIVSSGNEVLLNALVKLCIDNDMVFYFIGSDINLQSDLNVEYLYFEAKIMPKLND